MLSDLDKKRLARELARMGVPIELRFHAETGHPLNQLLEEEANSVSLNSKGSVRVVKGNGKGPPAKPAITISYRGKDNIHYLALPEGPELLPFLNCLVGLARGVVGITAGWLRDLANLRHEAELLVFVTPSCPHCPVAVDAALKVGTATPLVTVSIVDAEQYPELSGSLNVKSVPACFLDRGLVFFGEITPKELVSAILSRDKPGFQAAELVSLVETGRFEQAAGLLLGEHGTDALHGALENSSLNLRMGLFLAVERALEQDARGLDKAVNRLIDLLHSPDAALRGDVGDILGRIGSPLAVPALIELCGDLNPDVAEIASDALESIERSKE
ncbi:MAG: hypothetical protein GXP49_09950 [Deltaproteobacteria bacterium]|nr:hypothetical protein [Deltaproteobacteria bacterium]